jgi:hypothetical protein
MNVTDYIHMTFQHVECGLEIRQISLTDGERLATKVTVKWS